MRTEILASLALGLGGLQGPAPTDHGAYAQRTPRAVTASDLLALNDLGEVIRISPNGRYVAYQVHRADLSRNSYSSGWYIVSTSGDEAPRRVASGGEPRFNWVGEWEASPPEWAPDGLSFLYLRQEDEALQIWRAFINGRPSQQVTHNLADVKEFFWSRDGDEILFSTGLDRVEAKHLAEVARTRSILVDTTVKLASAAWDATIEPQAIAARATRLWMKRLPDEPEQPADSAATRSLQASQPVRIARASPGAMAQRSPDGAYVAYTDRPSLGDTLGDAYGHALYVRRADEPGPGTQLVAADSVYSFITDLWWSGDSRRLYYTRPVIAEGRWGLFVIDRTGGAPERVGHFPPDDEVHYCSADADARLAACMLESPTRPPEVGLVDLRSGELRRLTDLNPQWRSLDVLPASLVTWKNRLGHTAFARVLKPRGYVPGRRYPAVVTTYRASGFLRGAIGDEYPIQPLAADGFVVLSFNASYDARSFRANHQAFRGTLGTWASPTASIEELVRLLADSGLVDSTRVAITGLSYGAQVVSYAISHSQLFSAAIKSGCSSDDPIAFWLSSDYDRWLAWRKLGDPDGPTREDWQLLSAALNASNVRAPLLVNAASREVYCEMQLYGSLKVHRKPVELHLYPDERHVKYEPLHRREIYARNIDWLNFWLQGTEDPNPAKVEQYGRWRDLRALTQ